MSAEPEPYRARQAPAITWGATRLAAGWSSRVRPHRR
jgi:hypothetical protein